MSLDPKRAQDDDAPKNLRYVLDDSMRSMQSVLLKGQKWAAQSSFFAGIGNFSEKPFDSSPLESIPVELTLVARSSHKIEGSLLNEVPSTGDQSSVIELYEGLDTFGAAVEPLEATSEAQVRRASVEVEMTNFAKPGGEQTEDQKRRWETMELQGQDSIDRKIWFLEQSEDMDDDVPSSLPEIVLVDVDATKTQIPSSGQNEVRQGVLKSGDKPSTGDTEASTEGRVGPKSEAVASAVVSQVENSRDDLTSSAIRPAWEVDAFQWPAITSDLIETQSGVFEELVTSLEKLPMDAKTMAVTSLRTGDGRSVMSICVARWAAQRGIKTLLVDADFSRARLVASAGLEFGLGWQQMVTESVPVAEFLVASEHVPLTVMCLQPSSITSQNRSNVSKTLSDNLNLLKPNFDLIVVDSGTTRELEWLFEDNRHPADLGVFVCNLRRSEASDVLEARRQMAAAGFQHLAMAENFGRTKAA